MGDVIYLDQYRRKASKCEVPDRAQQAAQTIDRIAERIERMAKRVNRITRESGWK